MKDVLKNVKLFENAEIVRLRWLQLTIFTTLLTVCWAVLRFFLGQQELPTFAVLVGMHIVQFVLLYYFAYKKSGFNWLGVFFLFRVMGFSWLVRMLPQVIDESGAIGVLMVSVGIPCDVAWLFLSFKMLKINRRKSLDSKQSEQEA